MAQHHASSPACTKKVVPVTDFRQSEEGGRQVRHRTRLAIHVPDLQEGGVSRVTLNLAAALADRGHRVDLVLCRAAGPFLEAVPEAVTVVELYRSLLFPAYLLATAPGSLVPLLRLYGLRPRPPFPNLFYLPALVSYLRCAGPDTLLSAMTMPNLLATWAARLAGVPGRVVISQHGHFSTEIRHHGWGPLVPTIRQAYSQADVRIAVSNGVADDLSRHLHIPRPEIVTLPPAFRTDFLGQAETTAAHPRLRPEAPPVILGAGRLTQQKDFPTLFRAFARVRQQRRVRLIVLGEGPLRTDLEALARTLGIAADVALPGFVDNPFAYMARAAVFALSSAWEGLPGVLVEALAVGCPVVSTDCPSGPAEILAGGTYGRLVPVGDSPALAAALNATLDAPLPRDLLQRRAQAFSIDRVVDRYLDVLFPEPA